MAEEEGMSFEKLIRTLEARFPDLVEVEDRYKEVSDRYDLYMRALDMPVVTTTDNTLWEQSVADMG